MGVYKNVEFYRIKAYFGIDNRYPTRYKKVNFSTLYNKCVAAKSFGEKRHYVYTMFRNQKIDEKNIDIFWNRYVRLEINRQEKWRDEQRKIKQTELQEIMRGRYIYE